MNKTRFQIIGILPKNVHSGYRFGVTKEHHDWYMTVIEAMMLHKSIVTFMSYDASIYIASEHSLNSNGDPTSETSEVDIIRDVLDSYKCHSYELVRKGYDTISQLRALNEVCLETGEEMVVVTTWTHFLRAKVLCRLYGFDFLTINPCYKGSPALSDFLVEPLCLITQVLAKICGLDHKLDEIINGRRCDRGENMSNQVFQDEF